MSPASESLEDRLASFRQRCEECGQPLTPQRLAIYRAVAASDCHPCAEEIFRLIKPDLPSLSLGTVYRNLELLEENGLIVRLHGPGIQARFEANLQPHHHLVCVRCSRIEDFHNDQFQHFFPNGSELNGFLVLSHQVRLLGICADCEAASPQVS